jgi:hypothetical protein
MHIDVSPGHKVTNQIPTFQISTKRAARSAARRMNVWVAMAYERGGTAMRAMKTSGHETFLKQGQASMQEALIKSTSSFEFENSANKFGDEYQLRPGVKILVKLEATARPP